MRLPAVWRCFSALSQQKEPAEAPAEFPADDPPAPSAQPRWPLPATPRPVLVPGYTSPTLKHKSCPVIYRLHWLP